MAKKKRQRTAAKRRYKQEWREYEWRRAKEALVTRLFLLGVALVMITFAMAWLSPQ